MVRMEERAYTKQACFVGPEERMARLGSTYRGGLGTFR